MALALDMRLTLNPRLSRIVRALPQGGPLAWLEIVLLAGLAVQVARLAFAVATPISPLGDWQPPVPATLAPAARDALFARFDPFFRGREVAGPAVVTSLALKLFGIRLNEASGLGSAIVAGPDGIQSSVAVGDEIIAGVRLKSVTIDHVVIDRGGTDETLYLDQSQPAPVADPATTAASPPGSPPAFNAPPVAGGGGVDALRNAIGFTPRLANGQLSGLSVVPRGDGTMFQRAGFRAGDVIVRVDGRPIASLADAQALEGRLKPGAQVSVSVERGAQTVPLAIVVPGP